MREIRLYGSEGGGIEANRFFLPLSSLTLRVVRPGRDLKDAERPGRHSHAERGNELTVKYVRPYGDFPAADREPDLSLVPTVLGTS